jgi:hypothetical protein
MNFWSIVEEELFRKTIRDITDKVIVPQVNERPSISIVNTDYVTYR